MTACPTLVEALLQSPLRVHVYKQPASAAGCPDGTTVAGTGRSPVLVGTAELDLAPLLWSSCEEPATAPQQRSIAGSYPLLGGAAAAQGGASLAARVQLQLMPQASAAQQAAVAGAAGTDAAAAVWRLEGQQAASAPQVVQPPQQAMPQVQAQAVLSSSSSDDDDEVAEELLRRCQRLAATASGSTPMPAVDGDDGAAAAQQQQTQQEEVARGSGGGAAPAQQPLDDEASINAGGAGPAVEQRRQQPGSPLEADSMGKLLVQVHTALHLPAVLPAGTAGSGSGGSYSAYAQAVWRGQVRHQQRTQAVAVHAVDAGDLGGTAVWNAEMELPAAAAAWAASSGGAGPELRLDVWVTAGGSGAWPASLGAPDSLIGCAVLDLAALPTALEQAGWWAIVDSQQRRQGEVKVTVRPDSVLLQHLAQQAAASGLQQGEEQHAEDLAQQAAVQLRQLDLLSRRLASPPPTAAVEDVVPTAAPPPPAGMQLSEEGAGSDDDWDAAAPAHGHQVSTGRQGRWRGDGFAAADGRCCSSWCQFPCSVWPPAAGLCLERQRQR